MTDNTPTVAPTPAPTTTVINNYYFALLALLVIPCCIGVIVYFNWTFCCEADRTPNFHKMRKMEVNTQEA